MVLVAAPLIWKKMRALILELIPCSEADLDNTIERMRSADRRG